MNTKYAHSTQNTHTDNGQLSHWIVTAPVLVVTVVILLAVATLMFKKKTSHKKDN